MKKLYCLVIFFIIAAIHISAQEINPQITISFPNGGESFSRGSEFTIKWTSQQVHEVNIFLSLDNGLSWGNIFSDYPDVGEFDLHVPDTTSEQCLIKIESSSDSSIFDVSNNNFRIITTPRFSYFPLSPGNKWFFTKGLDKVIREALEVEKDTILNDGYSYAKLNMYSVNVDSSLVLQTEGYLYLRKEQNRILSYPDVLVLDFEMNIGDSAITLRNHYLAVLDTFLLTNILNRYLSTYYFFSTPFDYFAYSDSIGFSTLWATNFRDYFPEHLLGCVIDNTVYGNVIITGIEDYQTESLKNFLLFQNYPNPFNPTTWIQYAVPQAGSSQATIGKGQFVSLKVYDLLGREVATLVNEEKPAGSYEVKFSGSELASEIYFYKLQVGDYTEVKKMVLMK